MKDIKFYKLVVFVNSLVPLSLMGWDWYHQQLGANPVEFLTRTTGMLTLVFLFISLAVTPLRKMTGAQWIIQLRRMLGLYAFFYGFLHLLTYIWFDRTFNLKSTVADIYARPFIAVGMLSFFLMVPLAITSTKGWIKRLGGKRWARLHKLAYVAAVGGVIHFWMLVKSDARLPIKFAFVLAVLLGSRIVIKQLKQKPQTRTLIPPA
ncbi:MAG TPA: protein-methionine-sulfoxide reductase heme-binding subunit MsrQ [Pyrinomonadaceae bacterium]|nr:protein-methionine-sulfoxide reductase heme-binding subunit MsrQ [Pyrinomonadaceae bacterium]